MKTSLNLLLYTVYLTFRVFNLSCDAYKVHSAGKKKLAAFQWSAWVMGWNLPGRHVTSTNSNIFAHNEDLREKYYLETAISEGKWFRLKRRLLLCGGFYLLLFDMFVRYLRASAKCDCKSLAGFWSSKVMFGRSKIMTARKDEREAGKIEEFIEKL